MCIQAHGHACGVDADHAAANHQDFGRLHAGHAAQQNAGTALCFFQCMRTGLDRHAPGHFAHRRQQGQAALAVGDGLVGDAGGAGFEQCSSLFRIRRQVQIGVEQLSCTQHRAFHRLRFLDLDDHVGAAEDFLGAAHDFRTGTLVHLVGQADGLAAIVLDHHRVAVGHQLASAGGSQADAVFVVLDFPGDADQHFFSPVAVEVRGKCLPASWPYAVARRVSARVSKMRSMCDFSTINGGDSAMVSPVTRVSRLPWLKARLNAS